MSEILTVAFILFAAGFVVFASIRSLILWYFKINRIATDLRQAANDIHFIADHYRRIQQREREQRPPDPQPPAPAARPQAQQQPNNPFRR